MPEELYRTARNQQSVVARRQALASGLSSNAIDRRVAAGLLVRASKHCLVVPGHPDTWRQQLWIGVLDLGKGVVAGRAAAALHGLDGFIEGPLEYLVERPKRGRTTNGTVWSVPSIPSIDRVEVDGLPCCSATRALIDGAATWSRRELENGVDSALRLGLSSEEFLRRRLAALRHRGRDGVRLLDRVLDGAGGHSRLERRFLALIRNAGLPEPTCQQTHRAGQRFVARTDFSWEPQRTIVEVNGHATHVTRQQRARDAQRQAELGLMGWLVLTFTYEQVIYEPSWVVAMLRQALQAGNSPPNGETLA